MTGGRPDDRAPKPLSATLDQLLGTMKVPSVDVLDTVFRRWEEVVGPDLATHTTPSAIDGDRLVVTADDPAWASELGWLENEVIARLEAVSGSDRIVSLTVRVRPRS